LAERTEKQKTEKLYILKTVLLTGINTGLGKELFNQLVEKKYFVFGLLRNEEIYNELLKTKPTTVELILADISNDNCINIINQIVKDTNIDLVINNAGIGGEGMNLESTNSTEIINLINVHCLGVLRIMQSISKNLIQNNKTTVINLNSRLGSITHQSIGTFKNLDVSYSYRIAKASQNMLTNCLRLEFAGINFVSLTPGKLKTELAQVDANLSPAESAKRIIEYWEQEKFENTNGILEVPDKIMEW
jgi:short-subunit dehydrogenase